MARPDVRVEDLREDLKTATVFCSDFLEACCLMQSKCRMGGRMQTTCRKCRNTETAAELTRSCAQEDFRDRKNRVACYYHSTRS
jgi:hypothetical protein